ncbi:anthranilate synthase component I [Burkholderiaceae bacterium DAT-1]|nr:anthranilate synthase component I [Burkholderiaceae bacterium DAT-1]
MTELEFDALARQGYNRIPVVQEGLADLYTPLSAYLRLADAPYTYLLESVVGGERFGRYSFIGLPAKTVLTVRGKTVEVHTDGVLVESHEGDPLGFIGQFQSRYHVPPHEGLPRFTGGLVGYFGYETIKLIESRLDRGDKADVIGAPDIQLLLSEEIAIFDNLSGKLYLVVYADPAQPNAFAKANSRLHELRMQLREPARLPRCEPTPHTTPKSEFGETAFKQAVERAKQYILEGDIMQVVLSQRMQMKFEQSPITLYRSLRTLNPSPYMFYYNLGDTHIVGASPEILVRQERGTVTVRPIAGTRPRGKNRVEDLALEAELLSDPKEVAEHVMLMDLGRNDVGRIAETGSVRVTDDRVIERYSHVMHIVSSVEGKLKGNFDNLDVLKATFPAGTVSGAPKVRAMEIIDELEPTKRGIYAGAVGYLGFNGDMDLAIAIRTAVIKNKVLYVQAGAGIVADSVPQSEWQETMNKARAVVRAAELAQRGLDS